MHVALLMTDADFYAGTGYAEAWTSVLRDAGAQVERLTGLPSSWATGGVPRYDLVVPHVLVEEAAAFGPTLQAAAVLEATGVPLTNSVTSLVVSADKLATAAVWAAAGLPQPRTWDLAEVAAWPALGRPLVLKPALCDGARHIALVHDLEQADKAVRDWRADEARGGERRGTALLQEWVEEPACLRLFATPERVSLAHEKGREPGALVTSGTVYPRVFEPSAELAELAQAMVGALGGGLMGVDVLVDTRGRHLALEANAPFGFDVTDPAQGRWVAQAALGLAR